MKPIAAALSVLLALALLAAPVPSPGHQEGKVYRMGYFGDGTPPAPGNTTPHQCPVKGGPTWQAFRDGLREYGYLPGPASNHDDRERQDRGGG